MITSQKTAHRICPICKSTVVNILHSQRFALPADHPLPSAFDIVACPTCDFVYADTPADAAAYDRYYTDYSKYADQSTSTGGGGDKLDQARIDITAREISRHLHDYTAHIVDIGCANGGMLAALRNLGYTNLLGIDPSPECVANTKRLFNIPASQGWLGALPPEAAKADLIILSHVLEHVLNLTEAVTRIRTVLAPGGLVYVEVPDSSRYADCLAAPFQDFNTEHINHFNSTALFNLFIAKGFKLEEEGEKYLGLPGGLSYPACYAIFRLDQVISDPAWRRAPHSILSISNYITLSEKLLKDIDARLAQVSRGPVIVWGTGQLTIKLLVETCLRSAEIVAFVDGNPLHHGKLLHGQRILSPEELRTLPAYPIVIGTLLHHSAITTRIRETLGLQNPIITLA
jgi:SAM-dependent methyltransferase